MTITRTITSFESGAEVAQALQEIERAIEQANQGKILIETKLNLETTVLEWDAAASDYANKLLERVQDVPEFEDDFEFDSEFVDDDPTNYPNGLDALAYDDLTKLTHIGMKTEERLNADNVRTFADVAELEPSDLTQYPRVSYAEAEEIIAQAKQLAVDS